MVIRPIGNDQYDGISYFELLWAHSLILLFSVLQNGLSQTMIPVFLQKWGLLSVMQVHTAFPNGYMGFHLRFHFLDKSQF